MSGKVQKRTKWGVKSNNSNYMVNKVKIFQFLIHLIQTPHTSQYILDNLVGSILQYN